MIKNFPKGFTLAEVLVTLVVIGAISALTIPNLITGIQEQQYKEAWKKIFSDLSQATSRIMIDNGGTLVGVFQENSTSGRDIYAPYLSYVKSCVEPLNEGCWSNPFYSLNGEQDGVFYVFIGVSWTGGNDRGGLVLNNGMFVVFNTWDGDTDCDRGVDKICGSITVDVNGFKKPNTVGKDIFYTAITRKGLKPVAPYTCIKPPATGWDGNNNLGYKCSEYYLRQ